MNKILAIFARLSGGGAIIEKLVKYRVHILKVAVILALIGSGCAYASGVLFKIAACGTSISCVIDVAKSIPDDIKKLIESQPK